MYKLTVIAGPNRGTSYAMQDGETSIGRQNGNTVVLPSAKVSKRHCVLVVDNGEVVVKDQGSSNGTFVNGILTKLRKVKPGDRISVGEFVLELKDAAKRVAGPAPAISGLPSNVLQFPGAMGGGLPQTQSATPGFNSLGATGGATGGTSISTEAMPRDIKGRILWLVEKRLMPFFYSLNMKHEWHVLAIGMFAAFAVGNLIVSVYPLMESSRQSIVREAGRRARFMAKTIADHNGPYLAAHAETKTEIGIVEQAEGVRVALLTDLDSRIIAPGSRLNQYFSTGDEATFAAKMRNEYRNGVEKGIWAEIDSTTVVAIEPVKVLSPQAGRNIVVGMAIVAVDTSISTPDLGEMGMVYSETLILTCILGGLILFVLYRVTLKPFEVLNEDMDKALKGEIPAVTHEFKLGELNALWEIINSAIQRLPKGGSSSSGLDGGLGGGTAGGGVDEIAGPLRMIGSALKAGLVVFDSEKKIVYINAMFEEISGIRADSAVGQNMTQVARDQSMGAMTNDILDRASPGGDGVSEDYDFSGISYKLHAGGFGSPGAVKGYVLLAVRSEG